MPSTQKSEEHLGLEGTDSPPLCLRCSGYLLLEVVLAVSGARSTSLWWVGGRETSGSAEQAAEGREEVGLRKQA